MADRARREPSESSTLRSSHGVRVGLLLSISMTLGAGVSMSGACTPTIGDGASGAPPPDGSDALFAPKTGLLTLALEPLAANTGAFNAAFVDAPLCSITTTAGGCRLLHCGGDDAGAAVDAGSDGDGGTLDRTPKSAGIVTASGIMFGSAITLSPPYATTPAALLMQGGDLAFHADGADVPTFDVTIPLPPSLVLTAPGDGADVLLDQSLPLAWSVVDADHVVVELRDPADTSVAIACWYPAGDGAGAVGGAMFHGGGARKWTLRASLSNDRVVKAGDYGISARVTRISDETVNGISVTSH